MLELMSTAARMCVLCCFALFVCVRVCCGVRKAAVGESRRWLLVLLCLLLLLLLGHVDGLDCCSACSLVVVLVLPVLLATCAVVLVLVLLGGC